MATTYNDYLGGDSEVARVCDEIKKLSTADLAALRRMYLTRSIEAVGVVEKLIRGAGLRLDPLNEAAFESWQVVIHTAAMITGTGRRMAHDGGRPFGRALFAAGVKEQTLNRLLALKGPLFASQVRRIATLLARQKNKDVVPLDLTALLELKSPDKQVAAGARRTIARSFYAEEDAERAREKRKTS